MLIGMLPLGRNDGAPEVGQSEPGATEINKNAHPPASTLMLWLIY